MIQASYRDSKNCSNSSSLMRCLYIYGGMRAYLFSLILQAHRASFSRQTGSVTVNAVSRHSFFARVIVGIHIS